MGPPPPLPQPCSTSTAATEMPLQSPARPQISLREPSPKKKPSKSGRLFRRVRSVFRSFPIITPTCKMPVSLPGGRLNDGHIHGGTRMTGTLYGCRKARINLSIQENPRCLPMLVLELAIPTAKLLQEMGSGLVRIALECEKHPAERTKLLEEPLWTMYCNGKKTGYGVKRDPNGDDLNTMQLLHAVSMGAGVLPSDSADMPDGELTYMRAYFERVVGSKDSETFYMMNPDGNSGPEKRESVTAQDQLCIHLFVGVAVYCFPKSIWSSCCFSARKKIVPVIVCFQVALNTHEFVDFLLPFFIWKK